MRSDEWYFGAEKWPIYRKVIQKAHEREIPFAVGGGFAHAAYTGMPRNTKDVDLFILARDRDAMVGITAEAGLRDYYPEKPYDRAWIYRATKDDAIVDLIWAMANQRSRVDITWIERGPEIGVDGVRFRLLPPEELLWMKLYVIQRDRCDWPDAMNLLYARGPDLDWRHLLGYVGDDRLLLGALIAMFSWLCPDCARKLPAWLWAETGLVPASASSDPELHRKRAKLLDSRPWFVPAMEKTQGE